MSNTGDAATSIPGIVRRRAENLGAEGVAWLERLDALVEAIARDWQLTLGPALHGGSEAFVAEATMANGQQAILKVGLPGSESGRKEASVLLAAGGRGYATLFRHDEDRRAMLLERLGPRLEDLGLPPDEQMRLICEVLAEAWRPPPPGVVFPTGADKAVDLAAFIQQLCNELHRPCSERVIECALEFAERRRAAFDPGTAVLCHGDGHEANTLLVPGSDPPRFKFIDPDGLFIERAYDLGILMRSWSEPFLEGDALVLGHERAQRLSRMTGVPAQPIWEWGFIERVSTGLLLKQLGQDSGAAVYLAVAEQWAVRS